MNLYEITLEMERLEQLFGDCFDQETGEVFEEQLEVFEELQEEVKETLLKKSDNCIKYANGLNSEITSIDDEIKRLTKLKKVKKNKLDRFKDYIKNIMVTQDIKKITGDLGSISTRNSTQVVIVDEDILSDEYKRIVEEVKIDKKAIKDSLKNGTVEGAILKINTSVNFK